MRLSTLYLLFAVMACLLAALPAQAITPNEWRFRQSVDVPAPGLVRLNLQPETLDAARPGLEDIRLLAPDGSEVPFLLERPAAPPRSSMRVREFRAEVEPNGTRLFLETGATQPLTSVRLETAGNAEFIKAAAVEGSNDGRRWQPLVARYPIFRTRGGETNLQIPIAPAAWKFLRITLDDTKTPQIPFTGASIEAGRVELPSQSFPVTIKSRDETPGVTRLALDLGAANLTPAFLRITAGEPLFTRRVNLAVPVMQEDAIVERPVGSATIYRVDLEGKSEAHLDIPVETQIQARELILLVQNGDSPPLAVTEIKAERRLELITFLAKTPGTFTLLAGNRQSSRPNYDIAALAGQLKQAAAKDLRPGALTENPDYRAPDTVSDVTLKGAAIDVTPWKWRKHVDASGAGARQVELDPDVLAGAEPDLRDLRIVRDGQQIPFLVERTSISRSIALKITSEQDKDRPTVSRWVLHGAKAGVPCRRIACSAAAGLFDREIRVTEIVRSEHGDDYTRALASGRWQQLPSDKPHDFVLEFNSVPQTDTIVLETDNGDNPPIELTNFRLFYPVTRLVFAAANDSANPVWLYYGNPMASAPRYDVSLVAGRLLSAERQVAALGSEENVKGAPSVSETLTGNGRYIFWGVLAIAVVTLLALISKLLPKTEPPAS